MADEALELTRHDLEAKIVKRCWEDDEFRNEFTSDPVATAVKYLEMPANSLPRIVVHEEPPGSWHIVLPAKPDNVGELSEADLEKVAGGISPTVFVVASAAVATIASVAVSGASAGVTIKKGW